MGTRPYAVHKRTGAPVHPICYSEEQPWRRRDYSLGDIDWNELTGFRCQLCGGPFADKETREWLERLLRT